MEVDKTKRNSSGEYTTYIDGSTIPWKEYQVINKFKETDYAVKPREWAMLDYANPAWKPAIRHQDTRKFFENSN